MTEKQTRRNAHGNVIAINNDPIPQLNDEDYEVVATNVKLDEKPKPEGPSGFEQDVFNIASLVPTMRQQFKLTEGAAVKIIDLATTLRITAMTVEAQKFPFLNPQGMEGTPGEETTQPEETT